MDVETDERIQTMVRREFLHCTVLAIAHRIGTIIDYDAIVVLEKGRLVEHGSPAELLSKPGGGHFSRLVEDTGSGHAEHLRELAMQASETTNTGACNMETAEEVSRASSSDPIVGLSRPASPGTIYRVASTEEQSALGISRPGLATGTAEVVGPSTVEHSVSEEVVAVAHEGEIGARLKLAGAKVGALTCSLLWNNADDLDLHCESPTDHIHWNMKRGKCGGHLDVDMNASDRHLEEAPIENMYWDNPPPGTYRFWVENNTVREDSDTPFTVRLTKDGVAEDKHFDDLDEYDEQLVFEFEIDA